MLPEELSVEHEERLRRLQGSDKTHGRSTASVAAAKRELLAAPRKKRARRVSLWQPARIKQSDLHNDEPKS